MEEKILDVFANTCKEINGVVEAPSRRALRCRAGNLEYEVTVDNDNKVKFCLKHNNFELETELKDIPDITITKHKDNKLVTLHLNRYTKLVFTM